MSMAKGVATTVLLAVAAAALPAQSTPQQADGCFRSRDWEGWSAPANSNVLYLRVARNDIYRVELSPGVKVHRDGFSTLLTRDRSGSSWICRPIDLDLVVSDRIGGEQTLIARSLRKLSAEEIAAIPPKDLP